MTFEPIEHEPDDYEPADTPARPSAGRVGGFWDDLERGLDDPKFRRGYEKQTRRLTQADASRPSFPRRFWRTLTGRRVRIPFCAECGCPKTGDGCDCRFCNAPYPTGGDQ